MHKIQSIILIFISLVIFLFIFLTDSNYSIIVFPLFLLYLSIHPKIEKNLKKFVPKSYIFKGVVFLLIILAISFISEFGVAKDNKLNFKEHYQNILLFYLVWGIVSYLILSKFKFTSKQVFLIVSIFGIVVEQQFRFFTILLSGNIFFMLFWIIYVPLAYSPVIMIPYLLLRVKFKGSVFGL